MEKPTLPEDLTHWIWKQVQALGFSVDHPEKLAPAIKKLSDDFISTDPSLTPWDEPIHRAAYLSYFLPLNFLRCRSVVQQAAALGFFQDLSQSYDFGCGPGTLSLALREHLYNHRPQKDPSQKLNWTFYGHDRSPEALRLFESWPSFISRPQHDAFNQSAVDKVRSQGESHQKPLTGAPHFSEDTLLMASYSLNELNKIPDSFFRAHHLLLVEPSTKFHSKNLIELRKTFAEKGYQIWAPCLHQETCPMEASKKDWCHFKLDWTAPPWLAKLLQHVPMRNQSLSYSYLLVSRRPAPKREGHRIIGDARIEKGKTRWLVCHPSERLFASLLKRDGKISLQRGDILQVSQFEKKGGELRFKESQAQVKRRQT